MILVLDDMRGVVVSFQRALKRLSVPSRSAGTVAEARAMLPEEQWTGFILDLDLPDGSGLDVLDSIRSCGAYRTTPAVIVTASILIDPVTLSRVAGAGATLECGAFTTPEVDAICRRLVKP